MNGVFIAQDAHRTELFRKAVAVHNLIAQVRSAFLTNPEVEYFRVFINGKWQHFSRRQDYFRWRNARLSIPWYDPEPVPSKFSHPNYVLADVKRQRQRDKWLSEDWQ